MIRHEGKRHRCLPNMGLAPNLQVNSTIEHTFSELIFFFFNMSSFMKVLWFKIHRRKANTIIGTDFYSQVLSSGEVHF